MQDQRELFKTFYTRISGLDKVYGKELGKAVYQLLCNQTMALVSYREIEHQTYSTSAYFGILLNVCYNGKQIQIPGYLLLSMKYFNRAKPVLILPKSENLNHFKHDHLVNENGMVQNEFIKKWTENPSLFDYIRSVVDDLQGNPYSYDNGEEEDSEEEESEEDSEEETDSSAEQIAFTADIDYRSLTKEKRLGEGAFATVYKGIWNVNGHQIPVAIKEWKSGMDKHNSILLTREIEIQKELNHPNCIKLYGTSTTSRGYPVLVMELAECSLTDLTTKRESHNRSHPDQPINQMDNVTKCRIIKEIAEAIAFIHSKNYIHRDLKLDNILMKDGHPKIADFGLARACGNVEMSVTFAGSPLFMAPELICRKRVTNTIDCYSFGCLLTEILYEKCCYFDYRVRNQQRFFRDISDGLRPTILPETPKEVKALLNDCFKNSRYRPPMETIVKRISMWEPEE